MPFVRIHVDGHVLPKVGPALIAVNHTSFVDPIVVVHAMYQHGLLPTPPCGREGCGESHGHVRFMATSELVRRPVAGWLARRWGFIEVPWRRPGVVALQDATDALRRGEIVVIYPEGDVSAAPDGSPRRFRVGVGHLAVESGAPVIPLAHHDARKVGSGSITRSFTGLLTAAVRRPLVRVRVGSPVLPSEFAGLALREVVDLIQARVSDVWRTLSESTALSRADVSDAGRS